MSSIQSPLHSHILFLRHLSQHFQTYQQEIRSECRTLLRCEFCEEDFINGSPSIYCCEKCGFYIHTSCARSAPLQIQHPRHEHPLDLHQARLAGSLYSDYQCVHGCKYMLRGSDAMRTLRVEKYYCSMLREASDGESRLQFAHEHPLTTVPVRAGISCGGCKMRISEEEACGCSTTAIFARVHPLSLFLKMSSIQEIRSKNGTPLRCQFCLGDFINGSTSIYCCETCGFYFHTSCARPAPLQIQHPRHQHPLGLQQGKYSDYRCVHGCEYKLPAKDAIRTLQVEKYYCSMLQEASDGESGLQFAHEHPLTTIPVRTGVSCRGCEMQISEEAASGCSECNIFLHEACAKAPLEIQHHPFHPKHPLYLSYDSSCEGECHACRSPYGMSPIRYRCEECELIFDLSCVISTMPREDDDDDGEREDINRRPSVIDHPLHPHQLSSYHSKTQTEIKCSICEHHIPSGNFFGCSDCSFFLHGSCAQPPIDAIQHYLHPEHTLTFTQCPDEKGHKCAICESRVRSDSYCYTCQMCNLFIHPFCASATLSDLEKGVATTVQYPLHEHELKLYRYYFDFEYDFELDDADNPGCCTVCEKTIRWGTLAYKCFSQGCYFKIHKSCLQPPSELEHPSHSLHPLTFCFKPQEKYIACHGCYKGISNTAFYCGECNFYLHVDCHKKPTLKHPFHRHRLFYFEGREYNRKCRACHKSCRIDFFSCARCDYTLHYECSQLPLTLKSEHHNYCGSLVLRESFIEDERAEYYCDICERRRDPNKWVYFCETCDYNFVAHVECALSAVKLEVIEEDDFIRREEEIRVLQEQVDAKEASLRPLVEKLQAMIAEVELHKAVLKKRKAEHEKWINMGG